MTNLLYGEDMAASEDAMIAEIVHGFSGADSSQSFDSSSRRKIESIATNGWDLHDEASNMSAKVSGVKRKYSKSEDSPRKKTKLSKLLEEGKHGVIDGRWVCGECGKSLSTAWGLELHLGSVHGEYTYPCDFCELKFKRKDYAQNHMRRIHECTKTCPKCSGTFVGREAYAEHMKSVHKIKVTYKSTMTLKRAKQGVKESGAVAKPAAAKVRTPKEPKSPPKLSKNGKKLGRPPKKLLESNVDVKSELEIAPHFSKPWAFECKFCKKACISEDKLNLHLQAMHPQEMLPKVCTLCRRLFKDAIVLHDHIESHHCSYIGRNYTVLKCSYCSGVFHNRTSLEAHLRFYHMEEECLYCGSVFSGAFRMVEHISEVHPPFLTPFGHQCGCGVLYPARFHVLDHFRRRHVYQWGIISRPSDFQACPHCQLPFSSWSQLDQHVLLEHKSYGFFYIEPDYVAIGEHGCHDQLVLLPCPVCNDLYHDQVSLDKHIANDHEPFATRRPFNRKAVEFQMENIEYCMDKSVFADFDECNSDIEYHKTVRLKPKPKKQKKAAKPAALPVNKPSKVKAKKIIIPKKRTLKKLALIEERKRLKLLKEQEEERLRQKSIKKIKSDIDRSNIVSSRTRHSKLPSRHLPQRRSSHISPVRPRRLSSGKALEETPKGRPGRPAKSRVVEPDSEEDSQDEDEEAPTPSKRGRPQRKPSPRQKSTPAPVVGTVRKRYLIKDDPDLFHDSDEEVMPTPKQRGQPKAAKPVSSEESESDDEEDEPLVQSKKPSRGSRTVQKPSPAKKKPLSTNTPAVKRRYLIVDDPDLFNDSDEEVMPTPKRRGKIEPESESSEEGSDSDEDNGEEVEDEEEEDAAEEDAAEEVEDEEESDEEDAESEESEDVAEKPIETKCKESSNSDDELLKMEPVVAVKKMKESVVRRFSSPSPLPSDALKDESPTLPNEDTEQVVNDLVSTKELVEGNQISTNGSHKSVDVEMKNGNYCPESSEDKIKSGIPEDDQVSVVKGIPMTNGYDKSNGISNEIASLINGDANHVSEDDQQKSLPCTS